MSPNVQRLGICSNHSRTLLSPLPTSSNLTSSKYSLSASTSPPFTSALASFSASSSFQIFLRKNHDITPPPFLISSCVDTQYLARSRRCASTPFFAPRLSCCAADILTSWSPCKNASVCNGGSACAIGESAACGMPCGVYITHSAGSEPVDELSSPPCINRDERFLGVGARKGCVAKVMRSAEW